MSEAMGVKCMGDGGVKVYSERAVGMRGIRANETITAEVTLFSHLFYVRLLM